jgi:basic membrane protein A
MLAGTFTRFDVFAGPITDNTGKEILAAGEKLEQADLDNFGPDGCTTCMHWLVDGISGTIPSN